MTKELLEEANALEYAMKTINNIIKDMELKRTISTTDPTLHYSVKTTSYNKYYWQDDFNNTIDLIIEDLSNYYLYLEQKFKDLKEEEDPDNAE